VNLEFLLWLPLSKLIERDFMKKKLALLVVVALFASTQTASAVTKVTVLSQFKVSQKNPVVTMRVSGLPMKNGIYISQCMAPKVKGEAPTACNLSAASKVWVSNLDDDIAKGATSGKSKFTLKVDKYFKGGDCIHTTCVFYVTNDHNASADRSEDQQLEWKFGGIRLF
jgi:hypothetical protein